MRFFRSKLSLGALCGTLFALAPHAAIAQGVMDGMLKSSDAAAMEGHACGDAGMPAGKPGETTKRGGCCGGGCCGGGGGCGMSGGAENGGACSQAAKDGTLKDRLGLFEMEVGPRGSWPKLDLSEAQAAQIEAIRLSNGKQTQELNRALLRAKLDLDESMAADERDIPAIVDQLRKVQDVQLAIARRQLESEVKMEQILTARQREDLRWHQMEQAAMQ